MQKSLLLAAACVVALSCQNAWAQENVTSPDLLTFAAGVLPQSVQTGPSDLRTGAEQAISMIDGNPGLFGLTPKPATEGDAIEIVYSLPALTRFDRFAVPDIRETPSPFQTFAKFIEVSGAANSVDGPFVLLARTELSAHTEKGHITELTLTADQPEVLFVKIRLSGGVDVQKEKTFLEFSELIGNGEQRTSGLSTGFEGVWKGRGVNMELAQEGPSVIGCYDRKSMLSGTVEGNVLRALGEDAAGIPSQFILIAGADGALRGLRSTNRAPFKPYDGDATSAEPVCLTPEPPKLGCGSILHGIGFGFDSDVIRPESTPILNTLFAGLGEDRSAMIEIIGHSSSEGSADYNRDLSQRRASAVVAALVQRGLNASALSASGHGEDEPIASNADEAGRSLNRRVEVRCSS